MSKRYIESAKLVDKTKAYTASEAMSLVVDTAKAKFDESIELHVRLGVDGRNADQQVRGVVVLPEGTGRSVKVLVIAKGDKAAAIANIIFAQTSFNNVTTITPSSLPQLNGNIYHKNNNECLLYGYNHTDITCVTSRESEVVSFAIRNLAVAKYGSWDAAEFTPIFIEDRITITNNTEQNLLSALNIAKNQGIPSMSFEPYPEESELTNDSEATFDASFNTINYGKLQSANDTNLIKNMLRQIMLQQK